MKETNDYIITTEDFADFCNSMTNESLEAMKEIIERAQVKKQREEKEKKWQAICEAVIDYMKDYGDIEPCTSVRADADFSIIGHIYNNEGI